MTQSLYQPTQDKQIADRIFRTSVNGLYFIAHSKHGDARGFFAEIALLTDLEKIIGQTFIIRQMNLARSGDNVVRGIHCENWNKYVTVTQGSCFCAISDVTKSSPSYGQVETFMLGDGETDLSGSLYISKGLGNSLCITRGPVDYLYAVDALYRERDISGDRAVSLFDPTLDIKWPISREKMILSERDKNAVLLKDL